MRSINADRTKNVEYGEYYLVPNRNGRPGSKRFVKRPNPPPTSPPLDDDFDVITQDRTTMYGRGPGGDRYSWVPTQAPLDSDFDAVTYTNYTGFEKLDEDDEVGEFREEEVVGGIPDVGFGAVNGLAGEGSENWIRNSADPAS
ncbi:hypothetical protein MPER_08499 [Moniliophthora perniciosa FA553]|nr:hypothetical protein MPER_08499 [Moniliophthora perniciosa FA553]